MQSKKSRLTPSQRTEDSTALAQSRVGRVWVGLAGGALVLVGLLIFILQNSAKTRISFLVWDFTVPIGVGLLLAALAGVLVTALAGRARIWQLRHAVRRHPSHPTAPPP